MIMYYANGIKTSEIQERLTIEQFNDVYEFYGNFHKNEKLAIKDAEKFTKDFNKRWGTNYLADELVGIDHDFFEWDYYQKDWVRI